MNITKKLAVLLFSLTAVVAFGLGIGLGYIVNSSDNANDSHVHVLTHNTATSATCVEEGTAEYWYCSVCGKYYSDEGATSEVSQSSLSVAATNHTLEHANAVAATCTEGGNVEYWHCTVCGKYYSDEGATSEVSQNSLSVAATNHILEHANAVAATCTENGNVEYWRCTVCGKYYSDEGATSEVSQSAVTIATTEHDFAAGVCIVCGTKDEDTTYYFNIFNSIGIPGGFSVVLDTENTSITRIDSYGEGVMTFNVGEVTIKFDEYGNLIGWLNGEVEMDGEVIGLEVYFNDGVSYVKTYEDVNTEWIRMSMDDALAGADETAKYMLALSDCMFEMLQLIDNDSPEVLAARAWVDVVYEKMFKSIFDIQIEGDNVTLSLDADNLKATYTMLCGSTISEVIDYYFGNGVYERLQSLAASFDTLTLDQAVTYVENQTGISHEEFLNFVNNLLSATGVEMDETKRIEDVLSLTVDQAASVMVGDESFVLSEFAGNYLEQFKQSTILDVLENSGVDTSVITENAEYYIDLVTSLADLKLVTDRQGNLQTIDIALNYNGELEGEEHFKIVGGLQLVNGGETDDGFVDGLVEKVDGLYGNILIDGYYMDNISTSGDYAVVDEVTTIVNSSYAVMNIEEDGSYTLTVNIDIVITGIGEDGYKRIETYKGQYVLVNVMCMGVETVIRNGEVVDGIYNYNLYSENTEGILYYTYQIYYGSDLIDENDYELRPYTSLHYYYNENAD